MPIRLKALFTIVYGLLLCGGYIGTLVVRQMFQLLI